MITTYRLPEAAFTALAEGAGGPDTIRLLRDAQLSKHLLLLHTIAEAADGSGSRPGPGAFRAGYHLLTRVQASDPAAGAWLLGLPHLGGWAHDCLMRLEREGVADFAHLACLAASAAIRAGLSFDLDVPVRDGRVRLPGLGSWRITGQPSWIRLRCDGDQVTVGDQQAADRRLLAPDDGTTTGAPPSWTGTPMVRAVARGSAWNVLLETGDPYLDRYTLPMATTLSPEDLRRWRYRLQGAWEVLTANHRWAAEPIAEGISVLVPLTAQRDTDLVSATTPAAFGAISTSWPPDAVTLAETLVHEFQHVKLGALMDLVPLAGSGGARIYAPWRQDPRPASGLLQGVYAHYGIVRFWRSQRHAETDPDDILRAQVQFARWRPTVDVAVRTLLDTGCLTPEGVRLAGLLRARGQDLASGPAPDEAQAIAAAASLDHQLTWQLRHVAVDAGQADGLAAAYRRGEPFPAGTQLDVRVNDDERKVEATARSQLLNMSYLDPVRYRALRFRDTLALSEPDRLLLEGEVSAAIRAYRTLIADSGRPQPDAWIGLALALHRLPPSPIQAVFATSLAVLFEVHARLADRTDPLELAGWFG